MSSDDDLVLAQRLFWFSLIIVIVAVLFSLRTQLAADHIVEEVIASTDVAGCDNLSSQDTQIKCYLHFIKQGFNACDTMQQQTACFTALGIATKDEAVCHLPLLKQNLTFKNECMIGIIMERYGRD